MHPTRLLFCFFRIRFLDLQSTYINSRAQCKSLRQFPLRGKYQLMQIYITFFLPLRLYFFSRFLHRPFQWFAIKSHSSLEAFRPHTVPQKGNRPAGQVYSSCYSHRTTEPKLEEIALLAPALWVSRDIPSSEDQFRLWNGERESNVTNSVIHKATVLTVLGQSIIWLVQFHTSTIPLKNVNGSHQ